MLCCLCALLNRDGEGVTIVRGYGVCIEHILVVDEARSLREVADHAWRQKRGG